MFSLCFLALQCVVMGNIHITVAMIKSLPPCQISDPHSCAFNEIEIYYVKYVRLLQPMTLFIFSKNFI